jgi:hypothetical protein
MPYKNKQEKNEYQKNWMQKFKAKLKAVSPITITKMNPVTENEPYKLENEPSNEPKNPRFHDEVEEMKRFYIEEAMSGRDRYGDRNRAMSKRIADIQKSSNPEI